MILRHYQVMRQYHERHERPLTHAGRFWLTYILGVALVAAWVVA